MPKHAASRLWEDSPQVATLMYMLSAICGSCGVCVICVIVSVVKVFRKKLQRKCGHPKKCNFLYRTWCLNWAVEVTFTCRQIPMQHRKWLHLHVTGRSNSLKKHQFFEGFAYRLPAKSVNIWSDLSVSVYIYLYLSKSVTCSAPGSFPGSTKSSGNGYI